MRKERDSTPGTSPYVGYTATGSVWGSLLTTFAIVLPSLIIMLAICRAYFWLSTHFQNNPYFTQTLRMLRFTVVGLIASAALMLIKPTNFIDANSWILFGAVAFFTILPQLTESLTKRYPPLRKIVDISSHPILLIIAAGIAGYCIYA